MDWKNEEGFKLIFDNFYNVLCNYAYKILQTDMDAEDVVIETFANLWNKRRSINIEQGKLKSYLFSAVKNNALAVIRSGSIRSKHERNYADIAKAMEEDPSLKEDLFLFKEALKRSVRQLSPKTKEVYLLRTQNGLTFEEIGNHMKISKRTAENHMAKAVLKLRELIKENLNNYDL